MKRLFDRKQRQELLIMSGGRCAGCDAWLEPGYHADHKIPWSKQGPTSLENGQALCPECNRKKGAKMGDRLELRPWQDDAARKMVELVERLRELKRPTLEQKTLVMWLDPGMGKTILYQHCLNYGFRTGFISKAGIYAPRLNLCTQGELDWKSIRPLYDPPSMGNLLHAVNGSGMISEPGQFGFVSTYQSLISSPEAFREHAAIFERYDTALVLDEAQLLGVHGITGDMNKSTEWVTLLAERAKIIFVLSGTPMRADGKRLAFASYSEPDEIGKRYLLPSVRAGYLDGVKTQTLRPFEFELFNAQAIYEYLDGEQEVLEFANLKSGLGKILEHIGFWSPIVDKTIEKVKSLQMIYAAYCGLIACATQSQAREVQKYIQSRHPGIKCLLAVSDESLAKDNLRQFKMGGWDILITVAMAHVGYDHKPITVVCNLSHVREEGWLRQLFGRGWRWDSRASEDQRLYVYGPDDPRHAQVVNKLRQESQDGLLERVSEDRESSKEPTQERLGTTVSAVLKQGRAIGMDETTDVNQDEYPGLQAAARANGLLSAPLTGLKGLLKSYGMLMPSAPVAAEPLRPGPSMMTELEKRTLLRQQLTDLVRRAQRIGKKNGVIEEEDQIYTWTEMIKRFGKRVDDSMSSSDIQMRIDWVNNFWLPYLEQRDG